MISFKCLAQSRAARNAAASYLAFASTSLCGLVSIPMAVAYLNKTQMGLWTIVYTIVGYLLWMDLGIGNATGRKIAGAIANDDQREINRWWTLSIGVLVLLGVVMFATAGALSPFLGDLLKIPAAQTGDALWLFLGTAAISAVGMPFRAYPGLLIAQERFHWVPLVQALLPWLQLGVFWFLLHTGFGVRSYFPALAFSQSIGWVIFAWQVHSKGLHIRVDFGGWTKARFHELFSYSSSLAVTGIFGSLIQSVPSMLLARLGGLPEVPVYNLSNRGPSLISSLTSRTTHAFYPNLQKLFVSGELRRFRKKYREVNQLGVWTGLASAGAILAGNRSLICWLAKADFYAGHWANVWFACGVMTIPFVGTLSELLQYSGRMGKSAMFSMLELPVGGILCWLGYHYGGLPGLAAGFAALPLLVRGPYALYAGPRYCGFTVWDLCGNAIVSMTVSMLLVTLGGFWTCGGSEHVTPFTFLGRTTTLPTWREAGFGFLLAIMGLVFAIQQLQRIKKA